MVGIRQPLSHDTFQSGRLAFDGLRCQQWRPDSKTWLYDFDWAGAEQGLERSLELNPKNSIAHLWHAHLLASLGRSDEADRARERGLELDPFSAYINAQAGLILVGQRRDQEAVVQCRKALEYEPNHLVALYAVGAALARLSRHDEAVAALEKAASIAERASFHLSMLGAAYGLAGRGEDARSVLTELEMRGQTEYVAPLCFAWVLGAVGEMDRAFEQLEAAYQDRNGFLVLPGIMPFDGLRSDPQFGRFVRRMGLVC